MTKSISSMSVFIEFLAGSALAIFFHLVLHHVESAYIIFGVGVLLSLATYLLREDIGHSREKLCSQYNQAHEITFTVAQILDQECRDKAQEILAGTQRTLTLLLQGYVPLDENEFYLKGTKYFDESERQVKTVDPVSVGWDSRGALLNYYQANLRAMERGVLVTRIFVLSRCELADSEVQKVLLLHLRDGIEVRVAHRDEMPTVSDVSSLDSTSSFDFAIYDGKLATEVFGLPGKYFGRQTRDPALVANYQHLFDLIMHASHRVTMEGDRALVAGEPLPLGS